MIKALLILLFTCCAFLVKANDTLTLREAFTYNVGDTLDFKTTNYNTVIGGGSGGYQSNGFRRRVVTAKTFNTNSDTLSIEFSTGEQLMVTNLDSIAVFYPANDTLNDTIYYRYCFIDLKIDTTTYPHIISNRIDFNCFESGSGYGFAKGLGRTYYWSGYGDPLDGVESYSEELVYYSNGVTRIGKPIEDLDGSKNIHYVPLPEECATWTRTVNGPFGIVFVEQLATGEKHSAGFHTTVDLIYRSFNYETGVFIHDTVIGYFYNDTLYKSAYFVSTTGYVNSQEIYNTSALPGNPCGNTGMVAVDSVLIDKEYRTKWWCSGSVPYYGKLINTIAGIGDLSGLVRVGSYHYQGIEMFGQLTCFSVCGKTFYPTASTANCPTMTGMTDPTFQNTSIKLYPTLSDGNFLLQWDGELSSSEMQIFDLAGRLVHQLTINQQLTNIQVKRLSKGMYLWRAVQNEQLVEEGKILVE